jgi:hypothetical protein
MRLSRSLYALAAAGSLAQAAAVDVERDLASTIWNDIKSTTSCAGCEVRKAS